MVTVTIFSMHSPETSQNLVLRIRGEIVAGTAISILASGLLTDGSKVYARLVFLIADLWVSGDFEYIASGAPTGLPPTRSRERPYCTLVRPLISEGFCWSNNGFLFETGT
jgi:hypothetical protein